MDTSPKKNMNKETDEKNEDQIREDIKRSALEKAKQTISIVNVEEIAEKEARKAADDRMTESKDSLKGIKGGLIKIWKHTFFEAVYRQGEVNKVREDIKNTGNVYVGRREVDKMAHENTMRAVSSRFASDYEGTLTDGEEKKILNEKDPEAVKARTDIKNLLDSYAMNKIDDGTFNTEKNKIIKSLKNEDLLKGANSFADNLFEIAQNARLAFEHGAKIEELDYNLDFLIGKAKSSLKTEAHFNWVDQGVDKMKKSKIGRYLSPAVLSTGIGLAYSLSVGFGSKLAGSKVGALVGGVGTLGISVGLSTALAGMNESQRLALERKQRDLEAVEGGRTEKGDKRREQLDKYAYQTESSKDLAQNLRDLMFDKDKDGNDIVKDIKEDDVKKIMASIAEIDARKSLNSTKKIDLISYSGVGEVEKESTDLTILTARAKIELNKKLIGGLKSGIPNGKTFEEYLAEQAKTIEGTLLGGEKGVNSQDRAFSKHKAWRVTKKMAATATIGFLIGGTIQEFVAHFKDSVQGVFEGATNANGSHATIQTPFKHIMEWISGNPTHMDMGNPVAFDFNGHGLNFPEGTSAIYNPDGTINVVSNGKVLLNHFLPTFDANGGIDATSIAKLGQEGVMVSTTHQIIDSTKEVTSNVQDWIHDHPGETINVQHVHEAPFMDQGTPMIPDPTDGAHLLGADGNEVLTHWGGLNGTGINGNGDAVLNISHMTSVDSFHGDISVDVPEEMHNGNLMAIIYLDSVGSAGGQGIPVPIGIDGNIIFDHNNPIMQQIFKLDANGQMVSHAKVIEIVQKMGIGPNGDQQIRALGALVGEGLDKIKDIIPFHQDIAINSLAPTLPTELPMFVPIVGRTPLGPVIYDKEEKKKIKEEGIKPVVAEINPNKKEPTIEKDGGGDMVLGPDGLLSTEEKDKNKAIEIGQEEYDGIKDDLKMLNRKIKSSEGIITLSTSDFKSEYGKKRYMDLKSIQESRSKGFNKTENELQTIGDEMEKILMSAKIVSKEDIAKQLEKERKAKSLESDLQSDLEMLNKNIRESKGIITLDESSFKSDFGKEKYRNLKSIPEGKSKGFNKTENELQKIGDEMEKYLSNYQEAIKKVIPEVKKETTPNIQKTETVKKTTPENNPGKTEVKSIFTKEDLSKIGTEFKSEEGSFKVVKIVDNSWFDVFSPIKIEVAHIDKSGKETLVSYKKKDLESQLNNGKIKITKIDKGGIPLTNKKVEEEKVDEDLEKFMEQVSLLVSNAINEHLSGDNDIELKKSIQKSYPSIIESFKKEFESLNENEEKEMLKELALICKDKKEFIDAIVSFQKRENK